MRLFCEPTVCDHESVVPLATPAVALLDASTDGDVAPFATVAPLPGAVSAKADGPATSFVKVRVVVVAFVALSVATIPSVGELDVPADHEKLFVVTYGPPTGVVCVSVVCVQPVVVP